MMTLNQSKTVVVAMSGGVDSSVAAALLLEQGFNVIGITMKIYDFDEVGGNVTNETSCCGLGAMNDARSAAAKLGIPHYVVDFREAFGREVIKNFVDEYMHGRTPNPCVICNRTIKWGALLEKARALGADYLATGHYVRLRFDERHQRHVLSKAAYIQKDQSYALWGLTQEMLSRTMFPLGQLTKPEVRRLAQQFNLKNAEKQESFEICFVADDNYYRFLKNQVPGLEEKVNNGNILLNNNVVGKHKGYPFYTIGQRRGIGAFGKPMYVTGIESDSNTVFIGPNEQLFQNGLIARQMNLIGRGTLDRELEVTVKVRYKDEPTPATAFPDGADGFRVIFQSPKRAITPGQSAVLYDGDDVVGGGVIKSVVKN
ncbi:MAG: tRNA 2-thiouridine(34) synthase MnmA [bacterium]